MHFRLQGAAALHIRQAPRLGSVWHAGVALLCLCFAFSLPLLCCAFAVPCFALCAFPGRMMDKHLTRHAYK